MPEVNMAAMEARPGAISGRVSPGAHAAPVLDGAGWHSSPGLRVPDNIGPLPLPRYAPELNPVESVREHLRQNWLSHRVWDSHGAIVAACCDAWNALMRSPERIASITTRGWAQVKLQGGWYQPLEAAQGAGGAAPWPRPRSSLRPWRATCRTWRWPRRGKRRARPCWSSGGDRSASPLATS